MCAVCSVQFILSMEKDEARFLTFYEFMLINLLWKLSIKVVNKYIRCVALRCVLWVCAWVYQRFLFLHIRFAFMLTLLFWNSSARNYWITTFSFVFFFVIFYSHSLSWRGEFLNVRHCRHCRHHHHHIPNCKRKYTPNE